jgi:WhiB family transcriptional regulator, redox-sensing transcriptional regulator
MIEFSPDWRADGACRTADPDLFFPIAMGGGASRQIAKAQQICAGCPVKQQCLDFAMQTRESAGIWGGTTPEERIRVLRARHRRGPRTLVVPGIELPETRAS